jgi:hypothetical protein
MPFSCADATANNIASCAGLSFHNDGMTLVASCNQQEEAWERRHDE